MEYFQMMQNRQNPLDKGKSNKKEISNFRPITIRTTFSKIYEKVINDQLVSGLG